MLDSCDEKTPWTLYSSTNKGEAYHGGGGGRGEERRDVGMRMGIIVQNFYAQARILSQEAPVRLIIDFLINHLRWWLFVFPYRMINV